MKLETAILKACQTPAIYPEIEVRVRKATPPGQPFALAIALARLCNEGRLFHRAPDSYATQWPAYSVWRFRKYKNPKRSAVANPGQIAE